MFWFLLALLGFSCLRLHTYYQPIPVFVQNILGSLQRYYNFVILFTCLSLIGIAFFYNIPRSVVIWTPDPRLYMVTNVAMMLSCVFLVAVWHPSNIRRFFANPMAMTLILWSLSHLLVNGDSTSFLLFVTFFTVGSVESFLSSRTMTPDYIAWTNDIAVLVLAMCVYVFFWFSHQYYTGVAVLW
ncbi:MAG: NnrU family protein [Pseudomonadota bacterium]|nr:NnrU family protein [Pseudomonadota bacterium]